MLNQEISKKFKKDVEKASRQKKDLGLLSRVMMVLISGKALDPIYRDHQLKGEWRGWRECHVTSDWLLIYQINAAQKTIRFERLGSHAELF